MHKQENPRTTKSATQNAQITRVFFVLKAPREVHKQQQSIFNRSPYLKHSQQDIYYSTIIKPIILYGDMIWTSCNKGNLLKVHVFKNVRIILDAKRTTPFVALFNSLKWIPFYAESYVIDAL